MPENYERSVVVSVALAVTELPQFCAGKVTPFLHTLAAYTGFNFGRGGGQV